MKQAGRMMILMGLAVLTAASFGCGSKDNKVLAIVGGRKVTIGDFKLALNNLPENYKILTESYKGKHKILNNLVKKELLVMEAERREYQNDAAVKDKIKEIRIKTARELDRRIGELKKRRASLDQQVYENVLLSELNRHLKQEGLEGVEIPPEEIKTYFDDYARKLKILNPAARVPKLKTVQKQIQAILVEETLIRQLEKEHSVEIKEMLFKEIYGDQTQDLIIEDTIKR